MSFPKAENPTNMPVAYARHELIYVNGKAADYKVLEANDAFFRITGKHPEEIIGKVASEVFPDLEQEWIDHYIDVATNLKELHFFKYANKLDKHFEVYAFSATPNFFSVLFIDISEIISQQKQLAEENDYFLTTLRSIGDGVIVTDLNGNITLMNIVTEDITEFQNQDAIGKPVEEIFRIINTTTRRPVENPIRRVIEEGTIVGLANHTSLISKSGREYQISDTAAPIVGKDGNVRGVVLVFRDISTEYSYKEKLRVSESRFRNLFQNIPEAIILIENNRIVDCNRYFLELFQCQRDELLGRYPSEISPEFQHDGSNSKAKETEKIALAMKGEVQRFYWTHQRFDGSTLFCDISLTRVEVESATIIFSVVRDITEKVTLQEKVNQNERFLSNLISNLPGFAYQCANNPSWDMLFISDGCFEITGYSNTDFLQHSINYGELILPEYRQDIWEKWQETIKVKGNFELEYPIRHKNGKIKWVWERGNGIFSKQGELLCLEGFISDISEKYKLQRNLRESEEKYRQLVENAFDGIFLAEKQNLTLRYANDKFYEILEFPPSYFAEDQTNLSSRLTDESKALISRRQAERVEGKEMKPIFTLQWRKPDDSICELEVSISHIELDGESLIIGLVRDITESVKLTNTLRTAKENAEEISRLKSVFLANMSHELRTPLSGILGFSEILLEKLNDPELVEMAQYIKVSGNRLLNTLDSIITYGKLESGFINISISPFNIVELIKDCLTEFQNDAAQKDISLVFRNEVSFHWMHSDFRFVKIALKGLIENAIKFTSVGSVEISFATQGNGRGVSIMVKDTGIGIEEEHFAMIFEDFRQVSEGNTRIFEGTGLGLSLVKKTAELLNGSVEVNSKIGNGSVFVLHIPDQGC